jgi:hypothetical protein
MRLAGSSSWRFEHDDLDILHHAVFVRDAAMLPVAGTAEVPPRLLRQDSAIAVGLSEVDRGVAASDWLIWWRRMLDQAVREVRIRRAEDPARDAMTRLEARVSGRHEVCDPPDFASLRQMPELRAAAVATLPAYRAWRAGTSRPSASAEEPFAWQLVRDAAHEVAAGLGVPIDAMDAVAHVLDVDGLWSFVADAGCGACSVATSINTQAAAELLRELFISGATTGA